MISILPFRVLYMLSDLLSLVLRKVVRYRRDVVSANLRNAFPEKSDRDVRKITSDYYRNLSDIVLEIIKLNKIRPEVLMERFEFRNLELLSAPLGRGQSVIVAIGHCGNWEWMGTALGLVTPQKGFALTKPLSDANFHNYIRGLRHRLNPGSTIPFKSAFREMVRRKNAPSFYVMAADQTPTLDEANYWATFMNQETPFFLGIEKIARALDLTVLFLDIRRVSRGRYCGEFHRISGDPSRTGEGEITARYIAYLEKAIRNRPDNWLWSHRRWKHKRPSVAE